MLVIDNAPKGMRRRERHAPEPEPGQKTRVERKFPDVATFVGQQVVILASTITTTTAVSPSSSEPGSLHNNAHTLSLTHAASLLPYRSPRARRRLVICISDSLHDLVSIIVIPDSFDAIRLARLGSLRFRSAHNLPPSLAEIKVDSPSSSYRQCDLVRSNRRCLEGLVPPTYARCARTRAISRLADYGRI